MKICTFLFALFLLITIPASIFAGDYSEFDFISISENGKYMAFEEYGTQDGSGFPYSNIYFINIEQNEYAAAPVKIRIEKESAYLKISPTRAKAKKAATANLKKFGIVEGNTGRLVVARLLTDSEFDFSPYKDGAKTQTINFKSYVGSMFSEGEYKLTLTPLKVEGKKDYVENPVYKLELLFADKIKNTEKTLQKDKTLPESRGLPVAYRVEKIYLYKDKIIVFLNIFTTGFEGPDMRYMVVAGNVGK